MPITAPSITAKRVNIKPENSKFNKLTKSGLFNDSLKPKAKTNKPRGSKFCSKFFNSFLYLDLSAIPQKKKHKIIKREKI